MELSIKECNPWMGREVSADALMHVFQAFPSIEVLQVSYEALSDSSRELLKVLSDLEKSNSYIIFSLRTNPLLPCLRVLKIDRFPWQDEDRLSSLLDCLQGRAAHGMQLEELHLKLYGRPEGETERTRM
ncbi:hypothetical protein L226DRAFT_574703 [Lentinus tigrinus ALCF2SS1-7]|uniref:F-box domain-containing protein n=1 Tax=Lentinus tigrinus ALCF2SS1-6 TaxID=1328759 RepID=A0A5C2RQK4_9APHY|nr:hypothetical protein L227DRAFT_616599 [Lentinus tigrinus ALCF2SS1-6]RPD70604.1 hypothetical protein L226DRAFT_574703 [Lentinus tigrinus ALCF2SS1-7]